MTPSDEATDGLRTAGSARAGGGGADPEALRQLADRLQRAITATFDDWTASTDATQKPTQRDAPTFARPVTAPPVRMEQLARTPEPTADLDDLVDLLVPRLVEQLVPALRDALRDDS
jgi:hypothetical protein